MQAQPYKFFKKQSLATILLITVVLGSLPVFTSFSTVKADLYYPAWDFECHTFTHALLTQLTPNEIAVELENENQIFRQHNLPEPLHIAYPQGAYNGEVINVVAQYRQSGRLANEGPIPTLYPVNNWYTLSSKLLTPFTSFEEVKSWILNAEAYKGLLNIFTHDVQYPPRLSLGGCTPELLAEVLDFLIAEQNAGHLSVMTQRQAYQSFNGQKAVVVISFDDGWITDYTTVWSLFKARGLAGTSYISGAMVNSGNPDEITWAQVQEMAQGTSPQTWSVNLGSYPANWGITNLTGLHSYQAGTQVNCWANANVGYQFSYWRLNGTNVGSTNPHTLTVNANYELTAVFVEAPIGADPFLVARGQDNAVYYQMYNQASSSWQGWNAFPSGATADSPAAAVCQGKLYACVRGIDGSSIWISSINIEDSVFSGWEMVEGAVKSAPNLTTDGTHLFLLARGLDDGIYLRVYNCLLASWDNWMALPGTTGDCISAAVFEGNLHLVVRSVGDAKVLWHGYLNLATGDFSGWRNVPGASDNTPALAACSSQGCLILSVKGLDNAIYLNQWKDNTWSGWNALASGLTFDGPAGTCTGNVLQVVVRGIDGYSLWHCSYNVDSQVQLNWSLIEGSTPSTPKMTS